MTIERTVLIAWVKNEAAQSRIDAKDLSRNSQRAAIYVTRADHFDAIAALLEADGKRQAPEALVEVDRLTALASDERRRAERLHDDLLVEKGFVTVLRDDIARLKAKVARLEQEP